jgi:hypothetical protein
MINLGFVHAIQAPVFGAILADLPGQIRVLNKPEVVEIIGVRCPKFIQTRWVYLVDFLAFIIHHIDDVQTALHIAEAPLIPETYGLVCLIMLPLATSCYLLPCFPEPWKLTHAFSER